MRISEITTHMPSSRRGKSEPSVKNGGDDLHWSLFGAQGWGRAMGAEPKA